MTVTIGRYYKTFGIVYSALAAIPGLFPIVSALARFFEPNSSSIFTNFAPPLGDWQTQGVSATFLALVMTTLLVYGLGPLTHRRRRLWLGLLGLASLVLTVTTIILYSRFMVSIPNYVQNIKVTVSVGYERTEVARKYYPGWDDRSMLSDSGTTEAAIHALWTERSITIARATLWSCYTLALIGWLAIICILVYEQATRQASVRNP